MLVFARTICETRWVLTKYPYPFPLTSLGKSPKIIFEMNTHLTLKYFLFLVSSKEFLSVVFSLCYIKNNLYMDNKDILSQEEEETDIYFHWKS